MSRFMRMARSMCSRFKKWSSFVNTDHNFSARPNFLSLKMTTTSSEIVLTYHSDIEKQLEKLNWDHFANIYSTFLSVQVSKIFTSKNEVIKPFLMETLWKFWDNFKARTTSVILWSLSAIQSGYRMIKQQLSNCVIPAHRKMYNPLWEQTLVLDFFKSSWLEANESQHDEEYKTFCHDPRSPLHRESVYSSVTPPKRRSSKVMEGFACHEVVETGGGARTCPACSERSMEKRWRLPVFHQLESFVLKSMDSREQNWKLIAFHDATKRAQIMSDWVGHKLSRPKAGFQWDTSRAEIDHVGNK